MKKIIRLLTICLIPLLLTGCLYPDKELAKNKIPPKVQLENVQNAVNAYREETKGLLPIKTKPADTPIYEQHLIDFQPLKERGLIDQIPGSAFENGGFYQYAILDPDENPTVKVIDLRMAEKLRTVQARLQTYRQIHTYPPFGKPISGTLYELDYKKLKLKQMPTVESPYSHKKLPIIMDIDGNLYVDYRIDFYELIKEKPEKSKDATDLRELLTAHSPVLPAYSVRAIDVDGEPEYKTDK
ncbi:hypothetical protein QR721_07210 [Aciduricibacillus chroicocephali]|uniref:Lipoprotein n=1 Tax=Aciduricibacillus chroicocephali TaxID=3054939 RepID=A0ABY9KSD6_9BACI|nr:hypothetical protein QR721_07210 [Bacillaceae bacterium 44XB]